MKDTLSHLQRSQLVEFLEALAKKVADGHYVEGYMLEVKNVDDGTQRVYFDSYDVAEDIKVGPHIQNVLINLTYSPDTKSRAE